MLASLVVPYFGRSRRIRRVSGLGLRVSCHFTFVYQSDPVTPITPRLKRPQLTLVTSKSTKGYGHSTPATMAGRSFCMVYALIGIPLGLVMFQSIGERLNTFVGCALRVAKRCFNAKNPEVSIKQKLHKL